MAGPVLADEAGQSMVELAFLLTAVALVVVGVMGIIGGQVAAFFESVLPGLGGAPPD